MRWLAARKPLPSVIAHHVGEAAFLWTVRERAIHSSRHRLASIGALDQRLGANLAAIRLAGAVSDALCDDGLDGARAGDAFVLAYVATARRDGDRIGNCVRIAEKKEARLSEIAAGIAWAPPDDTTAVLDHIGRAGAPVCQRLVLTAALAAGRDPGQVLTRLFAAGDSVSRIAAIAAAAQLGRRDLVQWISSLLNDPLCAVGAALALLRLGVPGSARTALSLFERSGVWPDEESAAAVARGLSVEDAWEWHRQLVAHGSGPSRRIAVLVAAGCGDSRAVEWLVAQTRDRALARTVADAVQLIAEIRIDEDHLSAPDPETAMDDSGDAVVADDPDFDLPWPDASAIERWWQKARMGFVSGVRYLAGRPTAEARALKEVLAKGDQRQRSAAAQELVFQAKEPPPIFDTAAPFDRQTAMLVAMGNSRERR